MYLQIGKECYSQLHYTQMQSIKPFNFLSEVLIG